MFTNRRSFTRILATTSPNTLERNKRISFFAKLMSRPAVTFVSVFRKQDSRLCQEAEHVNRVSGGNDCTLYPL
jgi:hypothetical protein